MRHTSRIAAALTAASVHLTGVPPVRADVAGLVVGIDDYRHEAKLEGAVADAQDIDAALRRLGARVTLLLDRDATRARIEAAWRGMAGRAGPGDTLVFAFAGHGSRESAARGGREVNAFLLADFDRRSGDRLEQRIASHEIKDWFRATPKGVRVVFVADTCHSGLMLRGVDRRAAATVRAVAPYGLPDWAEVPVGDDREGGGDLKHVTFLAATQADRKIQAVPIGGRPRGALSYAFARVLERVAGEDGKLRRQHLESHVRPVVRQLSEGRQIPKLLPVRAEPTEVLLEGKPGPGRRRPAGAAIRLKVLNVDVGGSLKLLAGLDGAVAVDGDERPDLIWDAGDGSLVTGQGDLAAYDVRPGRLQAIVDRWRILAEVKRLAVERPLPMSLEPDDRRQPSRAPVAFLSEPPRYPYLTSFNLQADGSVTLLYPLESHGDPETWPEGHRYRLKLNVVPPFGADHLVLIASSGPLDAFHGLIRRTRAADLPELLATALAGLDYQIGIQALYTYDAALEGR